MSNGPKKNSAFSNFFRRTPAKPDVLLATPSGLLFGRNLEELCVNGEIPEPLMVIIVIKSLLSNLISQINRYIDFECNMILFVKYVYCLLNNL